MLCGDFICITRVSFQVMLRAVANNPTDVEMHALLQRNAAQTTTTHPCRGFVVVNSSRNIMEVQASCTRGHFGMFS